MRLRDGGRGKDGRKDGGVRLRDGGREGRREGRREG